MTFITVLAWIFGCWYTFCLLATASAEIRYQGSVEEEVDAINGQTKRFLYSKSIIIAIICWAWIITGGISP